MSKIKETIIEALMPVIKKAGEIELDNVLSSVKEHNSEELYRNTLKSIHSSFLLLKDAAVKTKTKIDDGIIDLVLETVEEKATLEQILLQ